MFKNRTQIVTTLRNYECDSVSFLDGHVTTGKTKCYRSQNWITKYQI